MATKPAKKDEVKKPLLGYPFIEKLIESEDFVKVNQSISQAYEALERMIKNKIGGLAKQKKVRAALKAYDLTVDLIRDLVKTKYDIISKATPKQSSIDPKKATVKK